MEPGRKIRLLCPFCQGGSKAEESLSISIESKSTAYFKCFRGSCSNTGRISTESYSRPNPIGQFKVKELLRKEEVFQSIDEEIALFFSSRLGIDKTTLQSCGVRRFFGSFPTTYEMEEAEVRPRSYAALISGMEGARQAMVGIDIKEAEGSVDAMVQGAGQLGAGYDPQLAKVLSLPKSSIKVLPGNKQVLWGHDDALSVPPEDRLFVEETHMLIIVETPLERLAMVQAGFDQGSIVSLPFGIVEVFQQEAKRKADLLKQDFKLKKQRSTKKEAQESLEGLFQHLADNELFDLSQGVCIALSNSSVSLSLAQELARVIGQDRCFSLHWPAHPDDIHGSSPHSTFHNEWIQEHEDDGSMNLLDKSDGSSSSNFLVQTPLPLIIRMGAHEMLLKDGAEALAWHVKNNMVPWPLQGLFQMDGLKKELMDLYNQRGSNDIAASTGWPGLDPYYKVVPGELTIVTGIPNSGKSEWIDALAVNLACLYGWPIAFCSFEKNVRHHAAQLLEKVAQKPFLKRKDDLRGSERMSKDELEEGLELINNFFLLIRMERAPGSANEKWRQALLSQKAGGSSSLPAPTLTKWKPSYLIEEQSQALATAKAEAASEEVPTIDWVLEKAQVAVRRHGIRGLVVDPYNELDHSRPSHMTETEYVSSMLSKVKRFAQRNDVHVWLVAHPRQLQDWRGRAPTLYDISGSAHFINKADNGIVVHRDLEDIENGVANGSVKVIVQKVRNKAAGKQGEHKLLYDRETGTYSDSNMVD